MKFGQHYLTVWFLKNYFTIACYNVNYPFLADAEFIYFFHSRQLRTNTGNIPEKNQLVKSRILLNPTLEFQKKKTTKFHHMNAFPPRPPIQTHPKASEHNTETRQWYQTE